MIKPIETIYKGYRFRSRLEARWAVFFDALKMKWEYEPEGFDLGEAGWYLPDFHLTGVDENGDKIDAWCEVKPEYPDEQALQKLRTFAKHGTLILLDGTPTVKAYRVWVWDGDRVWDDDVVLWSHRRRPWYCFNITEFEEEKCDLVDRFGKDWLREWERAVNAARGARFGVGGRG